MEGGRERSGSCKSTLELSCGGPPDLYTHKHLLKSRGQGRRELFAQTGIELGSWADVLTVEGNLCLSRLSWVVLDIL